MPGLCGQSPGGKAYPACLAGQADRQATAAALCGSALGRHTDPGCMAWLQVKVGIPVNAAEDCCLPVCCANVFGAAELPPEARGHQNPPGCLQSSRSTPFLPPRQTSRNHDPGLGAHALLSSSVYTASAGCRRVAGSGSRTAG